MLTVDCKYICQPIFEGILLKKAFSCNTSSAPLFSNHFFLWKREEKRPAVGLEKIQNEWGVRRSWTWHLFQSPDARNVRSSTPQKRLRLFVEVLTVAQVHWVRARIGPVCLKWTISPQKFLRASIFEGILQKLFYLGLLELHKAHYGTLFQRKMENSFSRKVDWIFRRIPLKAKQ